MMRKVRWGLFLCLMQGFLFVAGAKDYLAADFGAKADGITLNTAAIQKAIDFTNEQGGGRVVLTPGNYVCGTIYLKSNVTLHLEGGATLLGSTNPWDYRMDPIVNWYSFVYAIRQSNVGITGEGTINGRGFQTANNMVDYIHRGLFKDELERDRPFEGNRPVNLCFRECTNVNIKGITLRDPASWNQIYDRCRNLNVEGITVDSKAYWNNDGIDIVDCEDVVIRNCHIDAADDAFCLKSGSKGHQCRNILIENCVGRSSANGVKFGSASVGGFRDVTIRNLTIYDTYRSAMTFASVDGAVVENILVDGLKSYHTGNLLFLRTGLRLNDGRVGSMKNITIKNVYAEIPEGKPDAGYRYEGPIEHQPRNISPSGIVGIPEIKIQNVTLENIEIVYPGNANPYYAYRGATPTDLDNIPEMKNAYPEFSQFKELPAWGFYLRHAEGITFKNVSFRAEKKDYRPAFVTDDVNDLKLQHVRFTEPESEKKEQIITHKSNQVVIE